ncbi:hypothetical protein [Neisseria musculi]|uniref:Phage associated protein n=1 Tax=Neisseria musculi TaxID=1815583 RepID=A0A7H1MAX8_9NEIS|nr:hypothetical protein [Neisseria musculi]QNT58793.1 hypothetical protein H7A79_1031 [Neisseria musculi]
MPINPLTRTAVSTVLFIAAVLAVYFAGRIDGHRTAMQAAEKEKAEIIGTYQAAALSAEIRYSEKLAEAAAEKQKWFDFAQDQSAKLAAANRQLDIQTAKLQEQIPNAVKNDGNGFTGIGADSLRIYNRAFGYAD